MTSPLPDLESLRLLVAVARLGSIGAAGRETGVSQQSASERLRALETEVALVLVQRSTSGSTLTAAGRLLVEWATPLLGQAEEVAAALETLRGAHARELRVAASMTTAEHLVPRWLVALRRERDVAASLHATNTDAVLDAVRSGSVDVGFVEGPGDLTGLASRVVGHDELVLVAAPEDPWARRSSPLDAAEVAARSLTGRETGSGTRRVLEDALAEAGHPASPPATALTTTAAVLAAVRAGAAPAVVSSSAVRHDLRDGDLVEVLTALDLRRDLRAVWVGGAIPPRGAVRDLLGIAARSPAPRTAGGQGS